MRLSCKRYARLTMGFSRRLQNHLAALNLNFWSYNWSKRHSALKTTPAVASGIATRPMSMVELVEHIQAQEAAVGGRLTGYLPSPKAEPK